MKKEQSLKKLEKKYQLEEKKLSKIIEKKVIEEEKYVIKKRHLLIFGIIVLLLIYIINLEVSYSKYVSYDDSSVRERYSQLIENFNNLSKYHLNYKTSFVRGSVNTDVYYIQNNLFLTSYKEDGKVITEISTPDRTTMYLSRKINYSGECNLANKNSQDEDDSACTFEQGIPSKNETIPKTIVPTNDSLNYPGKIFLTEKFLNGEKIICFDKKVDLPLLSPSSLFGLGKYFPGLIKIIQKAPHEISPSDHLCYTEKGVLVQTPHYENFISIEYNFNNSFLSDLPLMSDFQRFVNISKSNRSDYYKFSIGNITTYFKDFENYATFGSFDSREYFTSGCANGSILGYNSSCTLEISYSQEWVNRSYYPLAFVGSEIIANESADCFNFTSVLNAKLAEKKFCIIAGGYMVSESFMEKNQTSGYEVTKIQSISQKEFDRQMEKAVYLASFK
ncbi:Uncharacterised protein [uncultured archaeon]|nr:Uncharacterised protein [uncultured archaeon]